MIIHASTIQKAHYSHTFTMLTTLTAIHIIHIKAGWSNSSAGLNLILGMQLGQGMACMQTSIPVSNATQ